MDGHMDFMVIGWSLTFFVIGFIILGMAVEAKDSDERKAEEHSKWSRIFLGAGVVLFLIWLIIF